MEHTNPKESWNKPYLENNERDNKKIVAGITAILLGYLGIHKFILGYHQEGAILLIVSTVGVVTSCFIIGIFMIWATSIIGLIEGIIYLTKSDEAFFNTYQANKRAWL